MPFSNLLRLGAILQEGNTERLVWHRRMGPDHGGPAVLYLEWMALMVVAGSGIIFDLTLELNLGAGGCSTLGSPLLLLV